MVTQPDRGLESVDACSFISISPVHSENASKHQAQSKVELHAGDVAENPIFKEVSVSSHTLHCFPTPAVTNYHKATDLKQHTFIISQLHSPGVQHGAYWGQNQGVSTGAFFSGSSWESPFPSLPRPPHSYHMAPFFHLKGQQRQADPSRTATLSAALLPPLPLLRTLMMILAPPG